MITIKYASREQPKIVSIEILSNVCININIHIIADYEKYFFQTVSSVHSRFNIND